MVANITNITNIKSIGGLADFANGVTDGYFWGLIVIAVFFIIVVSMKDHGFDVAAISGSFVCLLITILLFNIGLVSIIFPVMFAVFIAAGVFYIKMSNR